MRVRSAILGLGLCCMGLAGGTLGAAESKSSVQGPWLGVWQANLEKSTFQSNKPPAGTVRIYKMRATGPDTFEIVFDAKSPDGKPTAHMVVASAKFDGKPYPETGNPFADANRFTRVNDHSYQFTESKGDKDVINITVEISADGKTRTSRQKSVGPDGKPMENVVVWDRVE